MARQARELAVLEQIAMYLTALPCPPLPVLVMRAEEDGEHRRIATSSHDLMAGLLLHTMRADDAAFNARRKDKQLDITHRLITALEEGPPENAYAVCQRFTAEYLQSFEDGCGYAVQFEAAEDVERGSAVHKAACAWNAAQDIQHPPAGGAPRSAEEFERMTYPELIREHMTRVVRA